MDSNYVHDDLLVWGFQSTIDYRVQLSESDFAALTMTPPLADEERFLTKPALEALLSAVEAMGQEAKPSPGGSPLVSALAAAGWLGDGVSYFVGSVSPRLASMLAPEQQEVIEYAKPETAIGGTLALEYRPTSAKLMLAVPDGRWLDASTAAAGLERLESIVREKQPRSLWLGIGGLNKATPSLVRALIESARTLCDDCTVMATGGSFARALTATRDAGYWADLRRVFAAADVVSVSAEENAQLEAMWGVGWLDGLLFGQTKLVVTHSAKQVTCRSAEGVFPGATRAVEVAREEASRHAGRRLTGLGARFDGVLAASLMLSRIEMSSSVSS